MRVEGNVVGHSPNHGILIVGNAAYPLTIDFYLADPTGLQPRTDPSGDSDPAAEAHLQRRIEFQPATPFSGGLENIDAVATAAIGESSEVSAPVVVPEPARQNDFEHGKP